VAPVVVLLVNGIYGSYRSVVQEHLSPARGAEATGSKVESPEIVRSPVSPTLSIVSETTIPSTAEIAEDSAACLSPLQIMPKQSVSTANDAPDAKAGTSYGGDSHGARARNERCASGYLESGREAGSRVWCGVEMPILPAKGDYIGHTPAFYPNENPPLVVDFAFVLFLRKAPM
jgi:hypothetical protein